MSSISTLNIKMKNILLGSRFCCLCTKTEFDLVQIDTSTTVSNLESGNILSVRQVLFGVFSKVLCRLLLSDYICNTCRNVAEECYGFISNAEQSVTSLSYYLSELENELKAVEISKSESVTLSLRSPTHDIAYSDDDLKGEYEDTFTVKQRTRCMPTLHKKKVRKNTIARNTKTKTNNMLKCRYSDTDRKYKKYSCNCCNKLYKNENALMLHLNSKVKKNMKKCHHCSQESCEHHRYMQHFYRQKEKSNKVECLECSYTCKAMHSYICHINRAHLGIHFECNVCSKLFYHKLKFIYHTQLCSEYECPHCGNKFHEVSLLERHEIVCDKNTEALKFDSFNNEVQNGTAVPVYLAQSYKCNICSKLFAQKQYLLLHHTQAHKRDGCSKDNVCSICQKSVPTKRQLLWHLSRHEPNETHKCLQCKVEFVSRHQYLSHIKGLKHQIKLNPEVAKEYKIRWVDLSCSVCQMKFFNLSDLNTHLLKHGSDEKHKCMLCKIEFKTRREYKEHLNKVEHQKKIDPSGRFSCPYCEYSSHHHLSRDIHVQKEHLRESPYECHVCKKKFPEELPLQKHVLRHAVMGLKPKRNKKWICDACGRELVNSQALKKHMRLHTGERPYPCEFCSESFISASRRKAHVSVKHTRKSVRCPIERCDSVFHTVGLMRSHVKKVHWKRKEKFDYTKLEGLSKDDYELFRDRRGVNGTTAAKIH